MFTMKEVLSKRNIRMAFEHFEQKKDGSGQDGMKLSDLQEYWQLNSEMICRQLEEGKYIPGIVSNYEIVGNTGKRRTISKLNVMDRFLTRLLAQKLKRYIEPTFLENSYAYQENKGVLEAVKKAREYIRDGNQYVVEIDLKDFFDNINLQRLLDLLDERIEDKQVIHLICSYLYVTIEENNRTFQKRKGIIQGSSISPILSNLFLHALDVWLQDKQLCWMRFADNIYIYTKDKEIGKGLYQEVIIWIAENLQLEVNSLKSGVFEAISRRVLGYEFYKLNGEIDCRKYQYKEMRYYGKWTVSPLCKVNQQYHIVEDGILNKKDYSILFENEEKKYHIPVGVVEQINIYSDVIVTPSVYQLFARRGIKVAFYSHYEGLQSYFVPEKISKPADLTLKQCSLYLDEKERLQVAKKFQNAGIHQMKAVLKYYEKKEKEESILKETIEELNIHLKETNEALRIEELMLIEARARQKYYVCFNEILKEMDFRFEKRTKRPPKDALNAMISFGNTILYNRILTMLWKTGLDPRFGVVHASNKRSYSLNLDFADYFKPVIVDRIIFSLINTHQIKAKEHFEQVQDEGIYLSKEGKRIFIKAFEQKMTTSLIIKGNTTRYEQVIQKDIYQFKDYLVEGKIFIPYKYY